MAKTQTVYKVVRHFEGGYYSAVWGSPSLRNSIQYNIGEETFPTSGPQDFLFCFNSIKTARDFCRRMGKSRCIFKALATRVTKSRTNRRWREDSFYPGTRFCDSLTLVKRVAKRA